MLRQHSPDLVCAEEPGQSPYCLPFVFRQIYGLKLISWHSCSTEIAIIIYWQLTELGTSYTTLFKSRNSKLSSLPFYRWGSWDWHWISKLSASQRWQSQEQAGAGRSPSLALDHDSAASTGHEVAQRPGHSVSFESCSNLAGAKEGENCGFVDHTLTLRNEPQATPHWSPLSLCRLRSPLSLQAGKRKGGRRREKEWLPSVFSPVTSLAIHHGGGCLACQQQAVMAFPRSRANVVQKLMLTSLEYSSVSLFSSISVCMDMCTCAHGPNCHLSHILWNSWPHTPCKLSCIRSFTHQLHTMGPGAYQFPKGRRKGKMNKQSESLAFFKLYHFISFLVGSAHPTCHSAVLNFHFRLSNWMFSLAVHAGFCKHFNQ